MKKILIFMTVVCLSGCGLDRADIEILYTVSFANAAHHEAGVTLTLKNFKGNHIDLFSSITSPGRYARHDFSKNIYGLKAFDPSGELKVVHVNVNQWKIDRNSRGNMTVSYTLFGDFLDGTYSSIDSNYILLNIPSAFVWVKGLEKYPVMIKVAKPEKKWTIATQLVPTGDPETFTAPDLYYFLDSPIGIAPFTERKWNVMYDNKKYAFRLYVNHEGDESDIDDFFKMINPVIDEEIAVFGEIPDFDYGGYVFISNYLPYAQADGMEHRNSCVLTRNNSFDGYSKKFLVTLAHELFHSWNVKRLVPKSLKPFDFTDTGICGELWFAEGATVYYSNLIPVRAGINSIDTYADNLKYHFNKVMNSPALSTFSPAEMGMRSSLYDGASFVDLDNSENTYIHYFELGDLICMGLDLTLRSKYKNISLDTLMKRMWDKFGRNEKPYTNMDIQNTLAEITGDVKFADEFFRNYIYGNSMQDFKGLLSKAGLLLRKKNRGEASLGDTEVYFSYNRAVVNNVTVKSTPLYDAGIDIGDEIISLDGSPGRYYYVTASRHKPGDEVDIVYSHKGKIMKGRITFGEDDELEIVSYEYAGIKTDDDIIKFRQDWFSSKKENLK
jgi:predicted metalloprotease with PDZ domain